MNTSKDNEFKNAKGLFWNPWVGDNYFNTKNKLLIIGESHYSNDTKEGWEKHQSKDFTREVILQAIEREYYNTKIFKNLHLALFGNDEFNAEKFWNSVSYYNYIQVAMTTNKTRPSTDDFFYARDVFFEVEKILKPDYCLFLGLSSHGYYKFSTNEAYYKCSEIITDEFIGNNQPKRTKLIINNDREVNVLFIRHPSQYFSWEEYNQYLEAKMRDVIEELKAVVQ